jgi:transposase
MATWPHEWLFRRPSREKIVAAVGGGISKSQAARAFGVSLASVKPYLKKADRGEPPAPRKSPGSAPKPDEKATKLLEEDLKQRSLPLPSEKSAATTYTPSSWGSR